MNDLISYALAACIGSFLGIIIGEFIFIPYLKKKLNK